jgi:hypothetical protein
MKGLPFIFLFVWGKGNGFFQVVFGVENGTAYVHCPFGQ